MGVYPVGLWSCTHFITRVPIYWGLGFLQLYAGPPGCQNSGWWCGSYDSTVTGSSGSSSGATTTSTTSGTTTCSSNADCGTSNWFCKDGTCTGDPCAYSYRRLSSCATDSDCDWGEFCG